MNTSLYTRLITKLSIFFPSARLISSPVVSPSPPTDRLPHDVSAIGRTCKLNSLFSSLLSTTSSPTPPPFAFPRPSSCSPSQQLSKLRHFFSSVPSSLSAFPFLHLLLRDASNYSTSQEKSSLIFFSTFACSLTGGPVWFTLSQGAQNIVERLLQSNPKARMTVSDNSTGGRPLAFEGRKKGCRDSTPRRRSATGQRCLRLRRKGKERAWRSRCRFRIPKEGCCG